MPLRRQASLAVAVTPSPVKRARSGRRARDARPADVELDPASSAVQRAGSVLFGNYMTNDDVTATAGGAGPAGRGAR